MKVDRKAEGLHRFCGSPEYFCSSVWADIDFYPVFFPICDGSKVRDAAQAKVGEVENERGGESILTF